MGRRVRRFLIIIPAAAVVLLSVLLVTCSNEFDIFEAIKTEVKIANDLFLVVKSVSPANNATEISPSTAIVIEFDRALDESTIDESTVLIRNTAGGEDPDWKPIPNAATRTLTINADPLFDGPSSYQVTLTQGLKGADGAELREKYTWGFQTRAAPGGSIFFDTDSGGLYFNESPVDLTITLNALVTQYRYALIDDGDDASAALGSLLWSTGSAMELSIDEPVPSGNGYKRAYLQVRSDSEVMDPSYDRAYYDTKAPSVAILSGPPKTVNAEESAAFELDGWAKDSGSGFDASSFAWQALLSAGSGALGFTDASALDTKLYDPSGTTDGTFILRLTVTDRAGNSASVDYGYYVYWDRTRPAAPTVSGSSPVVAASGASTADYQWTWTSGGSSDAGTYYRYSLDSGDWSATTTAMSLTEEVDLGPHTLAVQERDNNLNWSSSGSKTGYVSPFGLDPLWGETGVSRYATLDWPSRSLYKFDLYFGTSLASAVLIGNDLTDSSYTFSKSLTAGTTFYWYYIATYGKLSYRYPSSTRQAYTFTTGK